MVCGNYSVQTEAADASFTMTDIHNLLSRPRLRDLYRVRASAVSTAQAEVARIPVGFSQVKKPPDAGIVSAAACTSIYEAAVGLIRFGFFSRRSWTRSVPAATATSPAISGPVSVSPRKIQASMAI